MPTGNQQDEQNPEENERPPDRAQVHFTFAVSRSRRGGGWTVPHDFTEPLDRATARGGLAWE